MPADVDDQGSHLLSHRCNVFVANLQTTASPQAQSMEDWSGRLARKQTVGVHYWIQTALQAHPWRVPEARQADIIFLNASLSYVPRRVVSYVQPVLNEAFFCNTRAGFSPRHCAITVGLRNRSAQSGGGNGGGGKSSACQPVRFGTGECSQQECSPRGARFPFRGEDDSSIVWIKDFMHRHVAAHRRANTSSSNELVAPFVVYQPDWLVSPHASPPATYLVPWAERKLVFYAGHMPAPTVYSPLRWHLWRQLVRDKKRASVYSSDIHVYWPYSLCGNRSFYEAHGSVGSANGSFSKGEQLLSAFLADHCTAFCTRYPADFAVADLKGKPTCAAWLNSSSGRPVAAVACRQLYAPGSTTVRKWQSRLRDRCPSFLRLNMSAELAAAGEGSVAPARFTLDEYMRHAMSHKFCIVSHGDDPTSHKLAETMAVAGAGGCLPIIVHPGPHAVHLPYADDIDYCQVGFIITPDLLAESAESALHGHRNRSTRDGGGGGMEGAHGDGGMRAVLDRLDTVSAAEAAGRHRVAAKLRGAFVQREDALGLDATGHLVPSAAHYLIAAMCAHAVRTNGRASQCDSLEVEDNAMEDAGPRDSHGGLGSHEARWPEAGSQMPKTCLPRLM